MSNERRRAPGTAEGWYALHDLRRIDWDAWNDAPARRQRRAIEEGIEYLATCESVDDASTGASVTAAVVGHKGDLLCLHLRPSLADLEELERGFERTALASFTERVDSYVSVTEISGYLSEEYVEAVAEGDADAADVDPGIRRYVESRLHPTIPDAEYVTFYPMDKRRDAEFNWYDLPFDERAELMSGHGDIGREYAGKVTQIITGSVGFDDHEWGVTLFADDPTNVKDLLYEMRFDPSTSRYAEFGCFVVGRRLPPANLGAYLAGESVPLAGAPERDDRTGPAASGSSDHGERHDPSSHAHGTNAADDGVRDELADLGVYSGQPHGEDVHAVVCYSEAPLEKLTEGVDDLRTNFDHYDSHVETSVYTDENGERAVVSLWETERAADTAAGFLAELPGITRQAGDAPDDSWGTMGMFYTVKPEHRNDFVDTFESVGELLEEMDGHRQTTLLENRADENDMFIASRWDSREDAMAFFRSDAFADTVEWGRDVLADRPRHVFLA